MPYKNKTDQKAWRDAHKEEARAYGKEYRKFYRETTDQLLMRRIKQVAKHYSLSPSQYFLLIEQQQNKCKICGKEETTVTKQGEVRPLCVDHCHSTGLVRGLLCNHCNSMLGHARDNIETLAKGIAYLEASRKE